MSLPISSQLLFAVPGGDLRYFATRLPVEEQDRVRMVLKVLSSVHREPNKVAACKRWSAHLRSLPEFAGKRGFSAARLRKLYYLYRETGDWRVCLNKSKAPEVKGGLPGGFLEWWRALCGNNQRVTSQAYTELIRIWRTRFTLTGKAVASIPGYDAWPEADPRTGVPAGWTEKNLYRHVQDRFELAAERLGRKAAAEHRLKVFTTRAGLRAGEFLEFDDHEFNVLVNFPGQRKAMRPRGFAVVDVLSSCCFSHALKPTLWDADEEKKRVLTERDFMWFVVSVLTSTGYRADGRGTTLVVEHGTAAIREAFEQRIADATGGKVRVARSGLFGRPAHGGQVRGGGGGNFRFKPHVEGLFRMLDDRLADLPAQVGKDRNHSPEQLPGVESCNRRLLKDAVRMEPERAAQFRFPVMLWPEFSAHVARVVQALCNDTEHDLEGWEKLGFVAKEWRLLEQSEWLPESKLLDLPDAERGVALALIRRNDLLHRARKLSRNEVFTAGRRELTRLPDFHLPALLGPEHALRGGEPLTVREGLFEFEDQEMGPDPFRFVAAGEHGRFREGEKFTCFVNPFNPSVLVACDAKLRVAGLCAPALQPARNDEAGVKRALGAARHWEAEALAPVQARHAADAQAVAFMRAHNEAVRAGRPVTPEEKANARALRQFEGGVEAFVDASQPAEPTDGEEPFNPEGLL